MSRAEFLHTKTLPSVRGKDGRQVSSCLQSVGLVNHAHTLSLSPRMFYFPQPSPHVHTPYSSFLCLPQSVTQLHSLRGVCTVCPDWIHIGQMACNLSEVTVIWKGERLAGWLGGCRCYRRSFASLNRGLGTPLALPTCPLSPKRTAVGL